MRSSRVTYEGAYHHVMSRGLRGEFIFFGKKTKEYFLNLLRESVKKYRIRLLAYTILDNHYHLILQNSSGRLSDFMRYLNGTYAIYYRKQHGGIGYVFQNRFLSTLIQKENYLTTAIIYVLLNPVRAGIVDNPYNYPWTSLGIYFRNENSDFVDNEFVESIYGSETQFQTMLKEWLLTDKKLKPVKTRFGFILGNSGFETEIENNFNRRKQVETSMRKRRRDFIMKPVEDVINDFEKQYGIKIEQINPNTMKGKELRNKLLVLLKDEAGMKYSEIIKLAPYRTLKYSSLAKIYIRTKEKSRMS